MEEVCSQYKIKLTQTKILNALFSWGYGGVIFAGVAPEEGWVWVRRIDIFAGVAPEEGWVSILDMRMRWEIGLATRKHVFRDRRPDINRCIFV